MNEPAQQSAQGNPQHTAVAGVGPAPEALVQRQLEHVGAAYAVIFVLLFLYAWRLGSVTGRLAKRVDELERDGERSRKR